MPRHHGFTCPRCGSHMFSTHTHFPPMGDKYPPGTQVGSCTANQYIGNNCTYTWRRDDNAAEAACMYTQTPEEWAAEYAAFLANRPKVFTENVEDNKP
jgi:hypothetical protein